MTDYREKWCFPIGGFVAMAFACSDRFIFVVTHSGRGVFDVATGERIARDYAVLYPESGVIAGIGPLQGDSIRVMEYDFQNDLVVVSESGRFRAIGESSSLTVEEAT